jgi:HK97 gp10 family phage protein
MANGITVTGLREAAANLTKIKSDVALQAGREASLAAGLVITDAVKRATYSTFNRVEGAIKSGFGVRVGHALKGTTLNSVVVEYPQTIVGAVLSKMQRHTGKAAASTPAEAGVAFWWRFLEIGTQPHRSVRMPSFMKQGVAPRTRRNVRAGERYQHSHSLGSIGGRSWVRPAFSSSAPAAIEAFRAAFLKRAAIETDKLQK